MAKRKEPDMRCQLWLLGRNCKARRCTNPAYGWDAHRRRACLEHMPKALLPAELKQQPNASLTGAQRPQRTDDEQH